MTAADPRAHGAATAAKDDLVVVRDLYKYFPVTAGILSRHVADVRAVELALLK